MRSTAMVTYAVEQIEKLTSTAESAFKGMALMSPFVWREGDRYRALMRAVPDPFGANDPTGIIISASSGDGLEFAIDERPAIKPGTDPEDPDAGGCEDPTVIRGDDGQYVVLYTGVDLIGRQGRMLLAKGPDLQRLNKGETTLEAPPGDGNIKEATVVRTPAGDWRLFYEYAAENASRIGIAATDRPGNEWRPLPDPFTVRDDSWDDWHLSTGPICCIGGCDPVMFYNGATRDARWRIGWISFDPTFSRITGRGVEPVLLPPPPVDRSAPAIAFAASAFVEGETILLYYSIEDRMLRRARIRRYA